MTSQLRPYHLLVSLLLLLSLLLLKALWLLSPGFRIRCACCFWRPNGFWRPYCFWHTFGFWRPYCFWHTYGFWRPYCFWHTYGFWRPCCCLSPLLLASLLLWVPLLMLTFLPPLFIVYQNCKECGAVLQFSRYSSQTKPNIRYLNNFFVTTSFVYSWQCGGVRHI